METYRFCEGGWDRSAFLPAWSTACKVRKEFLQEVDCIKNFSEEGEFCYTSMVTGKRYPIGTKFRTECAFESFGAPLIVLTDDLRKKDGQWSYGLHFEVVTYEGGCNVWRIVPADTSRGIATLALAKIPFSLPAGEKIRLEVETGEGILKIRVNDQPFQVPCEELPRQVHAGITACEGINRFYSFSIEE